MPLIIRDIVAADLDQWQELWAQYNAFYGRSGTAALDAAVVQST